jgi:hypothetical protein
MSKQRTNKEIQGYKAKPTFPLCSNCQHFKSEFESVGNYAYQKEVNIRCGLGGFKVGKSANCAKHEFKKREQKPEIK